MSGTRILDLRGRQNAANAARRTTVAVERSHPSDRTARGFTLIEILVVVAIIALLISILLPSLTRAREQARGVACLANLGQLSKAELLYQTQNREWIPGSPLTTGYFWLATGETRYQPVNYTNASFNRLSLNLFDWNTPLRTIMYGPNSIPRGSGTTGWEDVRRQLWSKIFEGVFNCPSNAQNYPVYNPPAGQKYGPIRSASYLTMSSFMRGGSDLYNARFALPGQYFAQSSNWDVYAGNGYRPKHSRLARESIKIFLADGFRYHDLDGTMDYDPSTVGLFGPFTASNPPALGGPNQREYGKSRRFSFRHRGQRAINAAFFDGHAGELTVDFKGKTEIQVGYSGSATDPRYSYPTGTTIATPSLMHKSGMSPGTTIP